MLIKPTERTKSQLQAPQMLRQSAARLAGRTPRVTDNMVALNILSTNGMREQAVALAGCSVADVAAGCAETAHLTRYVSIMQGPEAHVVPSLEWRAHLQPPSEQELERMDELIGSEAVDGSRLGSYITVTSALHSATFAVRGLQPIPTL